MKQLILTLILVTLSAPVCFGEWEVVSKNVKGGVHYVDFGGISQHSGYVFFGELVDYKPNVDGIVSTEVYTQADCDRFRYKTLSAFTYNQPMGKGDMIDISDDLDRNWEDPQPDSVEEGILKIVCNYVKVTQNQK